MVTNVIPSRREGMDHPDRTAVADDEHRLLGMALEHVLEEASNAGAELVERLGILGARAFSRLPAVMRLLEVALDLRCSQALPSAEPPLSQSAIESHFEAEPIGQDLRCFSSPPEVARIDHVDVFELGRYLARLPAA